MAGIPVGLAGGGGPVATPASCAVTADVLTCIGLDFNQSEVAPGGDTTAPFTPSVRQIVITIAVQMRGDANPFDDDEDTTGEDITNTATVTCDLTKTSTSSNGRVICDKATPTLTINSGAVDDDLTPQCVVLTGDTAVRLKTTCDIPTDNYGVAAARVVGNITSLVLNGGTDYTVIAPDGQPATETMTVTTDSDERVLSFTPAQVGIYTIVLHWNAQNNAGGGAVVDTPTVECVVVKDTDVEDGLYHIDPFGNPDIGRRDEERNLVGYQHTVCLDDDDGINASELNRATAAGNVDVGGVTTVLSPAEDKTLWLIQTTNGNADVRGADLHTLDFDNDGIWEECISWYSGNPGEQDITIIDSQGEVIAGWADQNDLADSIKTGYDRDFTVECFARRRGRLRRLRQHRAVDAVGEGVEHPGPHRHHGLRRDQDAVLDEQLRDRPGPGTDQGREGQSPAPNSSPPGSRVRTM